MAGETDLGRLLAGLDPVLDDRVYVFVTVAAGKTAPAMPVLMRFVEDEGETLIVEKAEAEAAGLAGRFPCHRITLRVHSALEAVGLIAAVAARLAEHGLGANPVAGNFHDHLFVPADKGALALRALKALAAEHRISD